MQLGMSHACDVMVSLTKASAETLSRFHNHAATPNDGGRWNNDLDQAAKALPRFP